MEPFEKGTWIVNSAKHITRLRTNTPELSFFEATEQAGKAGLLLARLVSRSQEVIPAAKVKIFAREAGVTAGEVSSCLHQLKTAGKVDLSLDGIKPKDVEVYCFSGKDAIQTVAELFTNADSTEAENASLISLERTFHAPAYSGEVIESITQAGFSSQVAAQTLQLQETLNLIKVQKDGSQALFFNEYAFADNPLKIAAALKGLSPDEKQTVEDIQELLQHSPGLSFDALHKFPKHIVSMMEGVGLLDVMPVHSPYGKALFVTLPQHKGISIGASPLSSDVFHKVKLMLSCLRYGEVKSGSQRGKIHTTEKLMNIVNKLNRLEWMGPCTAIGQDYQLLEGDGVIETKPASSGMCYMKLRQPEIGKLVHQIIEFNVVVGDWDDNNLKILGSQPTGYDTPESRRTELLATTTPAVESARNKLLQSLRTGSKLK